MFDFDVGARGRRHVDAGGRRGDDELDAVVPRDDGELVRADLVGRVAVCRYAVCADDHGGDGLVAHERRCHRIHDQCTGDVFVHELVGR